ncbi:MAG TPA: excisionase family DNA-binding protein [Actinomyces sp.]|nr:TOBE domain-containing protein [Acidobacteriota bacterium]HHT40689.1 excisionase family DNA-binding protein [Actinomyces sp.]
MHGLRVREVAAILGVSDDTVRRLIDDGTLQSKRVNGRITVDGVSLVSHMEKLAETDERSALGPSRQSIRNQMKGLVTKVTSDTVMTQVEMLCGPYRIVSLISTEAAQELNLEVGSIAIANMKATNVSISLAKD